MRTWLGRVSVCSLVFTLHARIVVGPARRQDRGGALEFLSPIELMGRSSLVARRSLLARYSGVQVALCDGVIHVKSGRPKMVRSGMAG